MAGVFALLPRGKLPAPASATLAPLTVPVPAATPVAVPKAVDTARSSVPSAARQAAAREARRESGDAAVDAFNRWAVRYVAMPEKLRARAVEEGVALAAARRVAMKALIESDPRRALENAVPPVVRQELPLAVVERLEERVNERAFYGVLGALPAEGVETPAYRREVVTEDGGRYRAFVYGAKLSQQTTERASIVGIAVDDLVAVDERPLRVVGPGEIPNHPHNLTRRRTVIGKDADGFVSGRELRAGVGAPREVIEVCPVSGIETPAPRNADGGFDAVAPQQPVVEAEGKFIFLCSGGHIQAIEEQLAAEGGNGGPIKPTSPPSATQSTGYKSHLLMRIAFPETRRESISEKEGHDLGKAVQDWFVDSSFGAMTFLTTVTPLIVLPRSEAWYKDQDTGGSAYEVLSDARIASKAAGFDPANFDFDTVIYTGSPGSFGGQAYVGGKGCWLKSGTGTGVAVHEYGHNFGLWHANFWSTTNGSAIGGGSHVEYGDSFDTMGSANAGDYQFNACHKNILNWLPTSFVHTVGQSGTFRVYQMDQPRLDPRLRYALKVRKDAARDYWVDLRQKFTSNAWVQGGVFLHWDPWASSASGSHLLDTTPGSADGKNDAPIVIGRTFSDPEADIHITPVAKNATSPVSVDVTVNVGPFPGNQAPAAALAASATSVATSAVVTFTATASDPDLDTLSYAWDFGDKSFSTANSSVVTKSWSTAGMYRVRCVASDMKGRTASASVVVTVGTPGTFLISGTITAGGLPLADVRMTGGTRETYTDSDGSYALAGVAAGTHAVAAQLYGYTLTPTGSASVTVGPNATLNFTAAAQNIVSIAVQDADCAEGANTGAFRISRTGSTAAALTVNYLAPSGSATLTTDYTTAPVLGTSVSIPSGQAFVDVVLTAVDDTGQESFETVMLEIQPSTSYALGTGTATLLIADADTTKPLLRMRVTDRDADESGDAAQFVIERIGPATSALNVIVAITGTAVNGTDYASIPTTVTIPAGAATVPITVTPAQDSAIEGMETVILTISTNTNYIRAASSADYSGTVNLHDDDEPILTVTATDAAAAEAASDPGVFTVARTGSTAAALTVNYGLTGSALHGTDYVALPGVLTIPAGSSVGTIVITPVDDGIGEPSQTARLYLRAGTAYAIGSPGDATVTITDNSDVPYVAVSTTASAKESGTSGTFKITTNGTGSGNITVRYTLGGTAVNGTDFTTLGGTVSMTKNTTATVTVAPLQDALNEGYESVTLTLTPDPAYTLAVDSETTLNIEDDELPQVNVSTTDDSFSETAGSLAKFFVSRTGATTAALTVNYTLGGTATSGTDYTAPSGSVTIAAAATGTFVDVSMLADNLSEGTETVILNVTPAAAYSLGFGSATRYIPDAQTAGLATVAFSPVTSSVAESAGTVNLNITLSAAQAGDVTVEWYTNGGTALGGNVDYLTTSGVVTFLAGETAQTVPITINDDTLDEANETVIVTLRNPNGARLGSASHTLTITDNDTPPAATVGFPGAAGSGSETVSPGALAVALSTAQAAAVTVDYAVTGGTASAVGDYTLTAGTLTFAAGETVKIIPHTIVNDTTLEPAETIILTLSNAVGAALSPNTSHTFTITDDDAVTVTITASDASASEPGDAGSFTLTRTGVTVDPLTVNVTIGGTATNGADYASIPTTAQFAAGAASVVVPVSVLDDPAGEGSETVVLTLAAGAYTIGTPSAATVTLADDEPTVTITATDAVADEGGGTGTFTITRFGATTNALSVNVLVTGTAGSGTDYAALTTPVVIPAGDASVPLVVTPIDDALPEPSETVIVALASGPYFIGAPASATVTIADDEPLVTIAATDPSAAEPADAGTFTITRAGGTATALDVSVTITGTATNGTDYATLASPVTIPIGSATATLTVAPIDDAAPEGSENVIVTLLADAAYTLGAQTSATVALLDDDVNNAPAVTLLSPTIASVALPNTVTGLLLEATATDDGKPVVPGALTTTWTKVSGPGTVTFDNASTPTTGARFSANGLYLLRLTANDGALQTVREVRVTVAAPLQSANVGTGAAGGSYTQSGGTFTLTGNGSSITNDSSDGFYFVWQTMHGSAWEVIARVASISGGSNTSSRAGIMARTATGSSDVEAFIGVTTNSRLSWITRTTAGSNAAATNTNNLGAPRWVRLVRNGSAFSAYHSTDGVNWTQTGTTTTLSSATDPMLVGLAVTNAAGATNAVATFTDVNIALTDNVGASVNAGVNVSGIPGQTRNLDATISDDGKPVQLGGLTSLWTKFSGPGAVAFGDTGATDTTVTFDTAGSYVLRLIANDGQVKTFDDTSGTAAISILSVGIVPGDDASELGPAAGSFYIQRDNAVGDVTVNFAMSGTAASGVDYTALPATGFLPDGVDFMEAAIAPIADALVEGTETVTITLLPGAGYVVGAANSETIDLSDAPVVGIAATASASEAGPANGAFTFTRSGPTTAALTVTFAVAGTATSGDDFAALPAGVTIPIGAASVVLEIAPFADLQPEGDETVELTIAPDAARYAIGTAAATVAIADLPIVSVTALAAASEAGAVSGYFQIARTGSTAQALTVSLSMSGSAIAGADYFALAPSYTIPANAGVLTIPITPLADTLAEGAETAILSLVSAPPYAIGVPTSASLVITDLPVDSWRQEKFGADAGNPAIAGDLADPDRDGLRNLLEYGFNTNPLATDTAPSLAFDGPDLVLIYRRNLAATDVTFDIRATGDFATWSDAAETESILSDDGFTRVIRAQLPYPAGLQKSYRIEVTRPAP